MSFFGANTRTRRLNHSSVEMSMTLCFNIPDVDQTLLQFIDVNQFCLVDWLLHFSPNFGLSDLDYYGRNPLGELVGN